MSMEENDFENAAKKLMESEKAISDAKAEVEAASDAAAAEAKAAGETVTAEAKAAGEAFEPDWITNAAVSVAIGFAVYFSDRMKSNK